MKIVTVQQMREIEQSSVDHGVSLDSLQRNAAAAIAREIERLFSPAAGPALFLVGPGNNGRDALIAARLLGESGWTVRAYLAPKVGSEDVIERLRAGGAEIYRQAGPEDRSVLREWIRESQLLVDGLLGIGIRGAVREPVAGIIEEVDSTARAGRVPVVAVDLPSGIDADTGEVAGRAIHAGWTVSLGAVKAGLLKFPAAEYTGTLLPVEIGLPGKSYLHITSNLLTEEDVRAVLPARPLNGHKGSFGRVLVVGGSSEFVGAPFLAGAAAARSGCGIVTLAVPEWQRAPLASLLPEATYVPLAVAGHPDALRSNLEGIERAIGASQAMVLGPGLGQGSASSELVHRTLEIRGRAGVPAVVDADALNILAQQAGWWELLGPGCVLTPHPGEMSRLTGYATAEVNSRRLEVATEAARQWGQVVVLKGAFTVVAEPVGSAWISAEALPALATGGTGDVLSGLIAGLIAQGRGPGEAARAAVFLHALAARQHLERAGTDRLLASDLLAEIPVAIRKTEGRW